MFSYYFLSDCVLQASDNSSWNSLGGEKCGSVGPDPSYRINLSEDDGCQALNRSLFSSRLGGSSAVTSLPLFNQWGKHPRNEGVKGGGTPLLLSQTLQAVLSEQCGV